MKKRKKGKGFVFVVIILIVLVCGGVYFIINNKTGNTSNNGAISNSNGQAQESEVKEEFVQNLGDGTKLNTSSKLKETKKIDNLEISNIQLTNKNGQSILLADVVNKGKTESSVMLIDILVYDKSGNEIAKVPGIISPLKSNEITQLSSATQLDWANAYDFKIVKKN